MCGYDRAMIRWSWTQTAKGNWICQSGSYAAVAEWQGTGWEIRVKTGDTVSSTTVKAVSPAELEAAMQRMIQDIAIDELIAEDDKVMVRWTQRGTHRGPFLDIPATGTHISYSGINIFRVAQGQIIEDTPYWDFSVVIQQLKTPSDEAQL